MPTQLKVVWESVPIPTKLILHNDPETVAICCFALASLYSNRESENFDSLVDSVSQWGRFQKENVRICLIENFGLRAKSLYSQVEVPAPSVSSKTKQNVKPLPEAPIDRPFLISLRTQYPSLNVELEYAKATRWYQLKGRNIVREGFIKWLNNASSENGKSNAARAVVVCSGCNGERRILVEDYGIATYIPCVQCIPS